RQAGRRRRYGGWLRAPRSRGDEVGNEQVGDGAAAAGNEVVTGTRLIAIAAAGDVVEVVGGDLINLREQVAAIERAVAVQGASLVHDRYETGPRRRSEAGAADLEPAAVVGVVDVHAGGGIGVEGNVRSRRGGADRHAALVGRLGLEDAGASAAAAPGGLGHPVATAIQIERRAADRQDVRRGGRI